MWIEKWTTQADFDVFSFFFRMRNVHLCLSRHPATNPISVLSILLFVFVRFRIRCVCGEGVCFLLLTKLKCVSCVNVFFFVAIIWTRDLLVFIALIFEQEFRMQLSESEPPQPQLNSNRKHETNRTNETTAFVCDMCVLEFRRGLRVLHIHRVDGSGRRW